MGVLTIQKGGGEWGYRLRRRGEGRGGIDYAEGGGGVGV